MFEFRGYFYSLISAKINLMDYYKGADQLLTKIWKYVEYYRNICHNIH